MDKTGEYMKALKVGGLILVIEGGLNWGFIGIFDSDLVALSFGTMSVLSRTLYVLAGIGALFSISFLYEELKD